MRVKDLIRMLSSIAESNPEVVATWEGTVRALHEDNVYLAATGELVIDADSNCDKDEWVTIGFKKA